MKYDYEKKDTLTAKRTLQSLSAALLSLLTQKSFESITVQELCSESLISRATFYNYFEDKYDLLNYFWYTLKLEIAPVPLTMDEYEKYLELFLEKCIDFFDANIENINLILKHNDLSHYLINSYRIYLNNEISTEVKACKCLCKFSIPDELAAQHYTNAVITLLEWRYIHKNICSKDELLKYLKTLINKLPLFINE